MEKWKDIRDRVLRKGVSIRQIQRETGLLRPSVGGVSIFKDLILR